MPEAKQQFSFASGELDPKLEGRTDIEQYYDGGRRLRNVVVMPHGGVKRRPGTQQKFTLLNQMTREASATISTPNGGTPGNVDDDDLATLSQTTVDIAAINPYVVAQFDLGSAKNVVAIDIHPSIGKIPNFDSDGNWYLQVSTDNVSWVNVGDAVVNDESSSGTLGTSGDVRRINSSSTLYRYVRFARDNPGTPFTYAGLERIIIRGMNVWTDNSSTSRVKCFSFQEDLNLGRAIICHHRSITLTENGAFSKAFPAPWEETEVDDITAESSLDTALLFHPLYTTRRLFRVSAAVTGLSNVNYVSIPQHNFSNEAPSQPAGDITPSATTGVVDITASATPFAASDVGQYVEGNGGRARIVRFETSALVQAEVEFSFFTADLISNGDWTLSTGYEDAWSDARGWPGAGTFHDGRLWVGGTTQLPTTIWAGRVGLLFDFSLGTRLADDGFSITLDVDSDARVTEMVSTDTLLAFTQRGVHRLFQPTNEPVTNANVKFLRAATHGMRVGTLVATLDSVSYFVDKGGEMVRDVFPAPGGVERWQSTNATLLSSHLVDQPVALAVRPGSSTDDADLLFVFNANKSMMIGTVEHEQGVLGWALQSTLDGSGFSLDGFVGGVFDGGQMLLCVRRTLNGTARVHVESMDDNVMLDSCKVTNAVAPLTTVTGLGHLEAETVTAVVGPTSLLQQNTPQNKMPFYIDGEHVVDSAGEIDLNDELEVGQHVQVGLVFPDPEAETMPIVRQLQNGKLLGKRARIAVAELSLFETSYVVVNESNALHFRDSENDFEFAKLFTGIRRVGGLRGWGTAPTLHLRQDKPLPFTLRALEVFMRG